MKDLFKSVVVYGLASVMAKIIGIFLMPIYTRVFSPADYGAMAMCTLFTGLFGMFANLNIHSGVARDYYEVNSKDEKRILISTGLWHIVAFSLLVLAVSFLFADTIAEKFLGISEYLNAFKVSLLLIPLSSVFTFFTIMMRFEKRPWQYTLAIGCQLFVQVLVSLVTILVFKWGIVGIFWGMITGQIVAIIFLVIVLHKNFIFAVDFKIIKRILAYSIPTLPAILGSWINDSLNRLVLRKYVSLEAVGYYSIALKIASVFLLFNVAFRNAWGPHYLENLKNKNHKKEFIRIYKSLLVLLSVLVITVTLFSKQILQLLTTKEYIISYQLIGFLCIYYLLLILRQIIGIGPQLARKTIYISISSISGMLVNVILMFILIPKYGVLGAPISLCIGGIVDYILSWYFTSRLYPIDYPKILTIMLISLCLIISFINILIPVNLGFSIIIEIAILSILSVIFRNNIIFLIKFIRNKTGFKFIKKYEI